MSLRNAAGMSPEELSLQDAYMEGQRAGAAGARAGTNPYQTSNPEYDEWERGRFTADGYRLLRRSA